MKILILILACAKLKIIILPYHCGNCVRSVKNTLGQCIAMKFSHYDEAWANFRKYVIMPELEKLRSDKDLCGLAERIGYTWSIIPDEAKGDMIKTAAEAYAHDGVDKNAAAIIRLAGVEGKKAVQAAADCQGAENELARLWSFLRLEDPGCTLEDSNDTSTPFGALAQISNTLRSAEAMADPLEIRRQIFDVLPENGAKKLLAKRWFASGEKAFYPKNFADAERRDSSGKLSSSDKTLLVWSITGEEPPEGFAGLSLIDASARNSVLKIFERTGDIQALLLFLAPKTEHYSVGVFLDYLLFALTYLPDDIDTRELLDAVAARPNASSELLTAVINLHTRKDADSLGVVQRLAAGNDAGAAAALYAFDPGALPDAANALKRAAAAGNMTAAYFLVRDLDEKSEEIRELAESSALSGSFVAENGIRPEARFFKALREEDGKTLAEAIKKLSQTEAKRLSGLWRRAAAENRSPEKLADIYAIGSVIDQAAGMKVEDLLYKATALGNLDALLDLYDLFAEKNYPVYQKRLREIALANYKLTPRQKARLGLLKVVNV